MAASPPLNTRKPFVSVLLLIICVLGGILIGAAISEPLALAAGVGVLASWVVGIFVVAPRAGSIARYQFMHSLAEPTEEDSEMIELASAHIVGNMAKMAEDEELSAVYRPIAGRLKKFLVEDYEMSLKNFASQRKKGIGPFNPENHLSEAELMQEMQGNLVGGILEPILNSFGFEGKQRENARAFIMLKMAAMGGGNSGSPSSSNFEGLQGGR